MTEQQENVFEKLNLIIKDLEPKAGGVALNSTLLEVCKIQLFVMATMHNNMQQLYQVLQTHGHEPFKKDVIIEVAHS